MHAGIARWVISRVSVGKVNNRIVLRWVEEGGGGKGREVHMCYFG